MSFMAQSRSAATKKEGKSRRAWTIAEERNLILAFRDIIAAGWKSPNGFRSGFLGQLEQRMKVYMPNTDLKGDPNISSKYTSWKKTYFQLATALSTSGFGWNSSTFTVEAEIEQWDSYLERYPTHHCLRGKPFPYYDAWLEIYGKDRANGYGAMDCNAAAEGTPIDLDSPVHDSEANSYHPLMPSEEDETPARSSTQKKDAADTGTSGKKLKKRKRIMQSQDQIVDAITEFCASAANSFKEAVSRMGSKVDAKKERKELFQAIGELPIAISIDDHVDATNAIANNLKTMDAFFGMSTNARIVLVDKVAKNLPK